MKYIEGKIEAVSTRKNGLKLVSEEKWRDVEGRAQEWLPQLQKGQEVKLGVDNDGKVIYILPKEPQPQPNPATTTHNPSIKVAALKLAVEIERHNAEQMNSTVDEAKVLQLAKKFLEWVEA